MNFYRALGTTLLLLVLAGVFATISGITAWFNRPPILAKPGGLVALEAKENRDFRDLLDRFTYRGTPTSVNPTPPDPDAPEPADTRLYNNLLDNLLSGLHYYYKLPEETDPAQFVIAWEADTGGRILNEAWLLSLENNVNYLFTLELYKRLHTKAVFDDDIVYAGNRVDELFRDEWHPVLEWPLGVYFDLIALYDLTGEDKYLEWADRYAVGDGPGDANTPLTKAKSLAFQYQYGLARVASPFYFYHAALLAEWGSRNDPAMLNQSRELFSGLRDLLFDSRYNMLWKQVSVPADGSTSRNVTQTLDTLEQLTAIRAIIEYHKYSGDPEAIELARALITGIWGETSPLLITPPEGFPPSTFFGLYTAYDVGREATRFDTTEVTIDHVLLYGTLVMLNEYTLGAYRRDVDFVASWMEDAGPAYRPDANGYLVQYNEGWQDPEHRLVSSKTSIWMTRALAEDEWYRFRKAQSLTSEGITTE